MNVPVWAWAAFAVFVLTMLALDLFVLHRRAREVSLREAGIWSAVWASPAFIAAVIAVVAVLSARDRGTAAPDLPATAAPDLPATERTERCTATSR